MPRAGNNNPGLSTPTKEAAKEITRDCTQHAAGDTAKIRGIIKTSNQDRIR